MGQERRPRARRRAASAVPPQRTAPRQRRRRQRSGLADTFGRQVGTAPRQSDGKRRAPAELALDANCATVQLDQLVHECEPDPRTLLRAAARALDPMKALEQPRQLLRCDANPAVGNPQLDPGVVWAAHGDPHAPLESELEGVGEEVEHHLFPHVAVDVGLYSAASGGQSTSKRRPARSKAERNVLASSAV